MEPSRRLDRRGHTCRGTSPWRGVEIGRVFLGCRVGIIVADYDLGNQAMGLECIDRLCRQRGQAIPALILTGHDRDALQAQLRDRDIAILAKPVRPAELRGMLRKLGQMRE